MKSIILSLILAASTALGSVIRFDDHDGDPAAITIEVGQPFTLDVFLLSSKPLLGFSYYLQSIDAPGQFSLVSRDAISPVFSDEITSDVAEVITATNSSDLGALKGGAFDPAPAGDYFVATYSFSTSPDLAPGNYSIRFSPDSITVDGDFGQETLSAGNVYQIAVVPEPNAALLALAGGVGVLGFYRRRA